MVSNITGPNGELATLRLVEYKKMAAAAAAKRNANSNVSPGTPTPSM